MAGAALAKLLGRMGRNPKTTMAGIGAGAGAGIGAGMADEGEGLEGALMGAGMGGAAGGLGAALADPKIRARIMEMLRREQGGAPTGGDLGAF